MYERALREVDVVLDKMDEKYTSRISSRFINMMIEKEDWTYDFKYDDSKSLKEQNISEEAKLILYIIYLRYFALPEEKHRIFELIKENDEKEEKLKSQEYDINNIWDNNEKLENIIDNNKNSSLMISKEKWYKKIFNKIKKNFLF